MIDIIRHGEVVLSVPTADDISRYAAEVDASSVYAYIEDDEQPAKLHVRFEDGATCDLTFKSGAALRRKVQFAHWASSARVTIISKVPPGDKTLKRLLKRQPWQLGGGAHLEDLGG